MPLPNQGIVLDRREYDALARLRRRVLTGGGVGVKVAVPATATTLALVWGSTESDPNYGVLVTPSWLTTVRVTGRTSLGCTVDFGTAAPAGATIDYLVVRA